eukprot:scaffold34_cov260-Pinguiococcus_pyrenoidosus.AAC.39
MSLKQDFLAKFRSCSRDISVREAFQRVRGLAAGGDGGGILRAGLRFSGRGGVGRGGVGRKSVRLFRGERSKLLLHSLLYGDHLAGGDACEGALLQVRGLLGPLRGSFLEDLRHGVLDDLCMCSAARELRSQLRGKVLRQHLLETRLVILLGHLSSLLLETAKLVVRRGIPGLRGVGLRRGRRPEHRVKRHRLVVVGGRRPLPPGP